MSGKGHVVTFSTYAPSPLYGGPARLHWLRVVLEQAGFTTSSVVVNTLLDAGSLTNHDLRVRPSVPWGFAHHPLYEDVMVGQRAAAQHDIVESVQRYLVAQPPQFVWLEQPWLMPLVDAVGWPSGAQLVYSSQNVEYKLKVVLENLHNPAGDLPNAALVEQVRQIEAEAVERAALVFSICEADRKDLLATFGKNSVVLPNGSSIGLAQPDPGSRFAAEFHQPGRRFFGFAASSYLPNQAGLAAIADPSLAFLPPNARIALAGSISNAVNDHPQIRRHWALNAKRLSCFGFLSAADFTQFSLHLPCTLVPIFHGGGSNLKTADALASGTEVIASAESMVGYEDVVSDDDSNLTVVHSALEFRTAMLEVLSRDPRPRVATARAELLSWPARLRAAATTLAGL